MRRSTNFRTLTIIGILAVAVGYGAPATAMADDWDTSTSHSLIDPVTIEGGPTGDLRIATEILDAVGEGPSLPEDTQAAVTQVVARDVDGSINTVVWNAATGAIEFYVYGPTARTERLIAEAFPDTNDAVIVPSKRSREELRQVIEKIAATRESLGSNVRFVSGTPSPDGSSITVGVDAAQVDALKNSDTASEIDGIPVQYVAAEAGVLTTRARTAAPVISGGQMVGTGRCSVGFPVLRAQDNQPNVISADHCDSGANTSWKWGLSSGSLQVGLSSGQAPGGTDLELFVQTASLSAYMFAGSYTDINTVVPIRGYYAPVGGQSICYNGSRSGIVCGNVVAASDSYQCVSGGFLQCYWVRGTVQSAGIPAAGNGDSGGPTAVFVTRPSDSTIGAYGIGIISMMFNPTENCTGDPSTDTRKCATELAFAPLNLWTSAQLTHNLAVSSQ